MTTSDTGEGRSTEVPLRRGRRWRQLLVAGVVVTLGWTAVSYLGTTAATPTSISVVPGSAEDGSIADVTPLSDVVTTSSGHTQQISGVKMARLEVALASQTDLAVSFAWQNASEFSKKSNSKFWQIRVGLHYPVHTGSCTGSDPDHAVTVPLTEFESWSGAAATFCAYRDVSAIGPGVVTSAGHDDQGTQLMAADYLNAMIRPQHTVSSLPTCTVSTDVACAPDGLRVNSRPYVVVASLLNPGGKPPPGQEDELEDVSMFIRVSKVGG